MFRFYDEILFNHFVAKLIPFVPAAELYCFNAFSPKESY